MRMKNVLILFIFGIAIVYLAVPTDVIAGFLESRNRLRAEAEKDRLAAIETEKLSAERKQQELNLRQVEERAHEKAQQNLRDSQPSFILPSSLDKFLARFPSINDFPVQACPIIRYSMGHAFGSGTLSVMGAKQGYCYFDVTSELEGSGSTRACRIKSDHPGHFSVQWDFSKNELEKTAECYVIKESRWVDHSSENALPSSWQRPQRSDPPVVGLISWRSPAASLEIFADSSVELRNQNARLDIGKIKGELRREINETIAALPIRPEPMNLIKSAACVQVPKQEAKLYIVRNGSSEIFYEFSNCREMIFEDPRVRKLLQIIDGLFIDPNLVNPS